MNTYFFRVHSHVTGQDHLNSEVISLESDSIESARAELHNAVPNAVGMDHIGTVPASLTTVNRGSW
jgi:hypothetical protein